VIKSIEISSHICAGIWEGLQQPGRQCIGSLSLLTNKTLFHKTCYVLVHSLPLKVCNNPRDSLCNSCMPSQWRRMEFMQYLLHQFMLLRNDQPSLPI